MYETFFGLKRRPFVAIPTLDRYFPTEGMEQAFRTVSKAIERGDGPVAVMGGTGVGKTLLALRIADAWRKSFEVILLSSSKLCSRRSLLQSLLFELRMPYRDLSEGELRLSLTDRLQPSIEYASEGLVLIIDEAQSLSVKLLEELRLLTNLVSDGVPRVRLVLVGHLRLDELLGHPKLESLNQRLAGRCYLRSLNANETGRYLKHKIEICGARANTIFTEDAIRSIHRSSDGIPRLIDQVADRSLSLAASLSQMPVSASMVEKAWAELQQLPLPWQELAPTKGSASVEFGELEREDEDEFEEVVAASQPSTTVDHDEVFLEEPVTNNIFFETIDDEFPSSNTYISYNTYDLDESITIENVEPTLLFDLAVNNQVQRETIMCEEPLAPDPFGKDFDSEQIVPSQSDSSDADVGFSIDTDYVAAQSEPEAKPIPIEPLEDSLTLDLDTVENEIREMISSLNVNSTEIGFGVFEDHTPPAIERLEVTSSQKPTASPGVLCFATLGKPVVHTASSHPTANTLGDDRDLLVVEEEVDTQNRVGYSEPTYPAQSHFPPHSYIQLFSKLRG